jgi:hypothetical protein
MKTKLAEIQPGAPDLPEVRLGHCGCVLSADASPVGYRFKASAFGDVRVPVYACREHSHLSALPSPNRTASRSVPTPRDAGERGV